MGSTNGGDTGAPKREREAGGKELRSRCSQGDRGRYESQAACGVDSMEGAWPGSMSSQCN